MKYNYQIIYIYIYIKKNYKMSYDNYKPCVQDRQLKSFFKTRFHHFTIITGNHVLKFTVMYFVYIM